MAWGSNTNPVEISEATKKVHYDDLWDKLQYVRSDVIPATTKMLFGQASAPQGWTKDTGTWTDDSMIVFTTGTPGSGGSTSPAAHNHGLNSHGHSLLGTLITSDQTMSSPGGEIAYDEYADKWYEDTASYNAAGGNDITGLIGPNTGAATGNTANSTQRYQEVIAATKDTYT